MRSFLRCLGALLLASIFGVPGHAQVGSATVTAVSAVSGAQTLKATLIGCSTGVVPSYQSAPLSITPNQPSSAFTITSGNSVTVTLPGNDQILCSGQNYTMYALTWYSSTNVPEGPTQEFRFLDGQTYNTATLTPVKFIPPTLNNASGVNCPAGEALTGFQSTFQPVCTSFASVTSGTSTGNALALAGGTLTGSLQAPNVIEKSPRVDVRDTDFVGGADPTGINDSTAAIQAAINYAVAQDPANSVLPAVYFAPGHYKVNGTLRIPSTVHLISDAKGSTVLFQTNPTASLITVVAATNGCGTAACYGSVEGLSLTGNGKLTTGTLLEMQTGDFILRDLQFYNTGGRGLQMNNDAERVVGYNLSFYYVRWPFIMAGDDNEDYFYNTHILYAGETIDAGGGPAYFSNYCYSINCSAGKFVSANLVTPTTLYPEPHAALYIDKSVNVSFIGGSFKASPMLSSVRIWDASLVKFQNIYHEDEFVGGVPRTNRAYILAGKAEQTYLTGALTGTGTTVAVNDASWMPQFFGLPADAMAVGNYYAYVLLPQDYNRASTATSAYVAGLKQNQYEIINVAGFSTDGNLYIGSRNSGGSTAPANTAWPSGTVIEQYGNGFEGSVELDNVHINQVQGTPTANGWSEHCDQTNVWSCGEIIAGYAPDVQSPTSNPATNQVGFYAPLGDANDPIPYAVVGLQLRNMEMFNNGSNPYTGQVVGHHFANIQVEGGINLTQLEPVNATAGGSATQQLSIGAATGGSVISAPLYATGHNAGVTVSLADGSEVWDAGSNYFAKKANAFGPYQQYGAFMNGEQFQNLYCMFDTPASTGHILSRFCTLGGPGNTDTASTDGPGYGIGAEWDYWNGSNWQQEMRAWSGGLFTQGTFTAAEINNEITVDGHTYTTLNQAWTAAVALTTTKGDQTIRLGPGVYPVTATLTEPTTGACVSLVGSGGTTSGADIAGVDTTLNVTSSLSGPVIALGNTTLTEGCTFRGLNILANKNATNGLALQWYRGLVVEDVSVNDTTSNGIVLGEASGSHQSVGADLRNVIVSFSSASFTPATRPAYGVVAQYTAIDSFWDTGVVRNALTAAFQNLGGGWRVAKLHGFGYPYTCTTAPCSNTATSSSASNASFATSYVVEDNGTGGNVYTDTYMDSPAIAAFHLEANGVVIAGGHIEWPDQTSFPQANLAYIESTMGSNLVISNIACVNMATSAGAGLEANAGVWISYQGSGQLPPTYSSVSNLSGCGAFYQQRVGASQTDFSRGANNMNNTNPGLSNGQNPKVLAEPLAGASNYVSYSAQNYTGYLGDFYEGHFSGQPSAFNVTADGTIRANGGFAASTVLVTSSTTLTTANHTVLANASSGALTLSLPNCQAYMNDGMRPTGLVLQIVKTDSSSNQITLSPTTGETINYQGNTSLPYVISSPSAHTLICASDYNWYSF